jgi:hypothetical protein
MGRKAQSITSGLGRLQDAARAVVRFVTRRRESDNASEIRLDPQQSQQSGMAAAAASPRTTKRATDIGLDVLSRSYTPSRTSFKTSFRSDGADHQTDQEFAMGVSDERWNDEDRYTNKSGDPRIGTHRRTYEPAESQEESRD